MKYVISHQEIKVLQTHFGGCPKKYCNIWEFSPSGGPPPLPFPTQPHFGTQPGGQIYNQCKLCHLVAKFATNASDTICWLNLE